jgi:ABC-type multidrug transport system permease subunit
VYGIDQRSCGDNVYSLFLSVQLASFTYSTAPYWLSQSIASIPILLYNQLLYGTMCFFMCGFRRTAEFFFYFLAVLFLCNLASYFFAMWLAAVLNNEQLAFSIFPLFFTFLLTFAGYSISVNDVPPFWSWAPWLSYARCKLNC